MLKDRPHFGNGGLRLFSDYRFFNHICKMINGVFTPPPHSVFLAIVNHTCTVTVWSPNLKQVIVKKSGFCLCGKTIF